jgi:formylglycine-generating enzyme required for sulfatase activity
MKRLESPFFYLFAISGSLLGTCACGSRTSVALFDAVDIANPADATLGEAGVAPDVGVVDAGEALSCPDAAGSLPSSCAPGGAGMTNCGAGPCFESCCTSLEVAAGTYYRTYVNSGGGPSAEANPAHVSGFRLDKYDVTVGRFGQFVKAWNEGYVPAAGSGKHTHLNGGLGLTNSGDVGTYEPGWVASDDVNVLPVDFQLTYLGDPPTRTQENLPIIYVNWFGAYAFCIWDGAFLPSEAEWEYAAAGGNEQREYPWGTTSPGTNNQYAIYGGYYGGDGGSFAPVGTATLGAGLWGQLDLAGEENVWTLDWWASYVDPCSDCAYLAAASGRVIRGGSYRDRAEAIRPPVRIIGTLSTGEIVKENSPSSEDGIGFRCARTP